MLSMLSISHVRKCAGSFTLASSHMGPSSTVMHPVSSLVETYRGKFGWKADTPVPSRSVLQLEALQGLNPNTDLRRTARPPALRDRRLFPARRELRTSPVSCVFATTITRKPCSLSTKQSKRQRRRMRRCPVPSHLTLHERSPERGTSRANRWRANGTFESSHQCPSGRNGWKADTTRS